MHMHYTSISISIFLTNLTHKCIPAKFDIYLHHFED